MDTTTIKHGTKIDAITEKLHTTSLIAELAPEKPSPIINCIDVTMNSKITLPWKKSDHYVPVPILDSWNYDTWQDWLKKHDITFSVSRNMDEIECSNDDEFEEQHEQRDGDDETTNTLSTDDVVKPLEIVRPPPPLAEHWVYGELGSRNALLIFRSCALAAKSLSDHPSAGDTVNKRMPAAKLHCTYKIQNSETKLITRLLDAHGLTEVPINASDYNLLWTGCHIKPDVLRNMLVFQRVNHFPRAYELTRKDRLYKNIEKMQRSKGYKQFDFIPQTFVMPTEYKELCSAHYRSRGPWIIKPVASSRGRGIHIVSSPDQVPLDEPVVVAKYIVNPLLIGGHKCDLRLYVVVTSFDPLVIYLYEEGLVRFATVPYDSNPRQLWNPCMHLCNYSINKYHCDYVKSDDPSAEDVGHKWTLSALLRHLRSEGQDTAKLMENIEDLVIKSLLACSESIVTACRMFVQHPSNCFELYGFDILIDSHLKPWLLEVNLSPSLGCDTPLDVRLKSAMLADLLTLIGIPAVDPIVRTTTSSSSTTTCSSTTTTTTTTINTSSTTSTSTSSSSINSTTYYNNNNNINNNNNNHFNHNNATRSSTIALSRSKFGSSCRRVHSADAVNSRNHTLGLSPDENRILRLVRTQYERRGGFVRIFPTSDTWNKYSLYLDPVSGVPIVGDRLGSTICYQLGSHHNYNSMLNVQLFKRATQGGAERLDRYERMLTRGHKERINTDTTSSQQQQQQPSSKSPTKMTSYSLTNENIQEKQIINKVKRFLETGYKLNQIEARKAFSNYLQFVLKRLSARSSTFDKGLQTDLILRFLQRASSQLRTPYVIKLPNQKLPDKDKNAIVARHLSDFLQFYNRETELFAHSTDRPNHIPSKIFEEFLGVARENDLEEALLLHMQQYTNNPTRPNVLCGSLQLLMRCLPNMNIRTRQQTTTAAADNEQKKPKKFSPSPSRT